MPNSPASEALFVRLYFDRHIMARLAIDLRSRGYDVLTTEEAGLDTAYGRRATRVRDGGETGHPDVQHSRLRSSPHAMVGGWPITCRDYRVPQLGRREYGLLMQRMLGLLNHFTAEELTSNIVHLEQFK